MPTAPQLHAIALCTLVSELPPAMPPSRCSRSRLLAVSGTQAASAGRLMPAMGLCWTDCHSSRPTRGYDSLHGAAAGRDGDRCVHCVTGVTPLHQPYPSTIGSPLQQAQAAVARLVGCSKQQVQLHKIGGRAEESCNHSQAVAACSSMGGAHSVGKHTPDKPPPQPGTQRALAAAA
jgi:hypothetical protein